RDPRQGGDATAAAVASVGEEARRLGDGAQAAAVNGADAGFGQALACKGVEVDAPVAGAGGGERGGRTRVARGEGLEDLFADLVGLRAGGGAEPGDDVAGCGAHCGDRLLQYARGQAAPAGMGRADLAAVA